MEFCPKCGSRLVPLAKKLEDGRRVAILQCRSCGFQKEISSGELAAPIKIEHKPREQIAVVTEEDAKFRTLPTARAECPKCGNLEAYVWLVQTRGADESSTQFFRCTKCGYTWREYS